MAISRMADVAKIFGIELNEEFKLKKHAEIYKFTEEGLVYYLGDNRGWRIALVTLNGLLRGEYEIEKLPWMPKEGENYYYVSWLEEGNEWKIRAESEPEYWPAYDGDVLRVDIGNCFRTREEAEAQKYEVFKRLTGKDWHETYGKEGGNNATD